MFEVCEVNMPSKIICQNDLFVSRCYIIALWQNNLDVVNQDNSSFEIA